MRFVRTDELNLQWGGSAPEQPGNCLAAPVAGAGAAPAVDDSTGRRGSEIAGESSKARPASRPMAAKVPITNSRRVISAVPSRCQWLDAPGTCPRAGSRPGEHDG
jgi:hypothetical protein